MASYFADSNINATSSSWKAIDSTSLLDSTAASTATTSSYVSSATFTPGAITVEGIVLRLVSISASPSGTFEVQLWNNTDSTQAALVSCNVSDLATLGFKSQTPNGLVYFKFGSPVTSTAGKAYAVRIKSTSANQVTVYRNATGGNWSRLLVTSTTGTPGAGDSLYMSGNTTGAGSTSTISVTWDQTATTLYSSINVGHGATLACENSSSKNYNCYVSGLFYVGGTFEIGNSGALLPSSSTFTLNIQSASAAGNAMIITSNGTFRAFGTSKTRTARAAADFSNGATSITTNISTGWKNGDVIGIGASARSATPASETKALTADASGTTLTISAVGTGKSGTATTAVPLINLTSNINIIGSSATNTFYIALNGTGATLDVDSCTFQYMGSATAGGRGLSISANSVNLTYKVNSCGFYNLHANCVSTELSAATSIGGTVEITNNVQYGGAAFSSISAQVSSSGFSSAKINGNWHIGQVSASGFIMNALDRRFEIKDNVVNASVGTSNFTINTTSNAYTWAQGTIDNNKVECCANQGFVLQLINTVATNFTSYRCSAYNFQFTTNCSDSKITGLTAFGATTANLLFNAALISKDFTIDGADIQSGTGDTCPRGITNGANAQVQNLVISNSSLGTVTQHSTADVAVVSWLVGEMIFKDSTLASTTQVTGQSNLTRTSSIRIQKSGGVAGTNRVYWRQGRTDTDSTIYDTSVATTNSFRATPSSATEGLYFPIGRVAIPSGSGATLTIKVRKSVVGDGAAYNGNQPKIIMIANAAAGSSFDSDSVVMTATNAANGAWETLTYSIPTVSDNTGIEFWAQVDGTTGWANIDTMRVS